mgnify:CR=1 FL=1
MAYWQDLQPRAAVISGPGELDAGIEPCPALITSDNGPVPLGQVVRVPWTLDEIELVHLAKGGTLWLSTWGGLPIHMLEVQAPNDPEARGGTL